MSNSREPPRQVAGPGVGAPRAFSRAWLLVALLAHTGCGTLPGTAPRRPWFETEPNLLRKAAHQAEVTLERVDPHGLLLYHTWEPLSDPDRYLRSHDIADAPAWQGYLLAALAFEEAVSGRDRDPEIRRLAGGLLKFYEVTGVRGLLGRSMVADYTGPRLWWMWDEAARPDNFWMQGPTGVWWRNGLSKAHLTLACFGCAMPLILERRGDVALSDETRQTLVDVLLPAVRSLVDGGFCIRDWDGRFTRWGDLGPQFMNGFNMLCTLSMLRSAGAYDEALGRLYEEKAARWGSRMATSLQALGTVLGVTGHWWIGKPSYSDLQCLGLAGLTVLMQEDREAFAGKIREALDGLWAMVRYERNAPYTLCYAALVRPGEADRQVADLIQDLRDFPLEKRQREGESEITGRVQPLANRPFSSNYWKSCPYRRIVRVGKPIPNVYTGQDYLLVYWMGRYFGLVPAE